MRNMPDKIKSKGLRIAEFDSKIMELIIPKKDLLWKQQYKIIYA